MTILQESTHTAEFLLSEGNGQISRQVVVLGANAAILPAGQLLGKLSAGGAYVAYDPAAATGAETVVAILYARAPIAVAARDATVIARSAEVASALLVGLDAAARVDLAALGIVIRD
jgi:hypothetical protein